MRRIKPLLTERQYRALAKVLVAGEMNTIAERLGCTNDFEAAKEQLQMSLESFRSRLGERARTLAPITPLVSLAPVGRE